MKFKIDENLPAELATDIRTAGHEADTVFDQNLSGATDSTIMARVQADGRALLTMDKGIADIRAYPPHQYAGIILFRPSVTGRTATLAFIRRHLAALLQSNLPGHLFVVSESGIRVR
jgi:predicted nuclease of predicted toxin-antitoxin system